MMLPKHLDIRVSQATDALQAASVVEQRPTLVNSPHTSFVYEPNKYMSVRGLVAHTPP